MEVLEFENKKEKINIVYFYNSNGKTLKEVIEKAFKIRKMSPQNVKKIFDKTEIEQM